MAYRSNAAEAWYEEPSAPPQELRIDLLPPASLTQPLWKSLLTNLRHTFALEKLPPLQLTSRPVDVGLALGERLQLPWFRTVFTNIGDVISPETLPPLDLESVPVDVGELITDQLSHFWFSSLLRNLADRLVPEKLPTLELTSKPVTNIIPETWILLPAWSEVISTPKVFYPDKPKAELSTLPPIAPVAVAVETAQTLRSVDPTQAVLLRDLRRSRIRRFVWIGMAAAQAVYLIVIAFTTH
ncbi:MAG: hypothetical protein HY010_21020 [Acidobacteria bacterium]|nr:hypothetical protein [Acidobacteriota bacterium]